MNSWHDTAEPLVFFLAPIVIIVGLGVAISLVFPDKSNEPPTPNAYKIAFHSGYIDGVIDAGRYAEAVRNGDTLTADSLWLVIEEKCGKWGKE
ncbi:MAG: hypothetical protein AB1664_00660 [Thermodesulfobacteriota bacterium]